MDEAKRVLAEEGRLIAVDFEIPWSFRRESELSAPGRSNAWPATITTGTAGSFSGAAASRRSFGKADSSKSPAERRRRRIDRPRRLPALAGTRSTSPGGQDASWPPSPRR